MSVPALEPFSTRRLVAHPVVAARVDLAQRDDLGSVVTMAVRLERDLAESYSYALTPDLAEQLARRLYDAAERARRC